MPRPKIPRFIASHPDIKGFAPDGTAHTGEAILSVEEFEAIRLSDYQGLDQSMAAEQMNVSRQTFGRILKQARYNLSEALVMGKRLRVTGGCYKMQGCGRRRGQANRHQNSGQTSQQGLENESVQGRGPGPNRKPGQGRGKGPGGCGRKKQTN